MNSISITTRDSGQGEEPGQPVDGQRGRPPAGRFPEIVLLYCRQAAEEWAGALSAFESVSGFAARPVLVPCGAKVEVHHLLRILESGADGVEVVTCPEGRCRSVAGNLAAARRVERARRLLDAAGLGADRLGISSMEGGLTEDLIERAAGRAAAVRPLGPNPMKAAAAAGAPEGRRS